MHPAFPSLAEGNSPQTVLSRPPGACALLVLAHGAGAGMRHPFLERLAGELSDRGVATLRYQFPYLEGGERRPDPPAVLVATVRTAIAVAAGLAPGVPLFAGGKSLGGRMTSTAATHGGLAAARGLVFFGFPLHPPGKPGMERARHLKDVVQPMLFLQGTRDALAHLELLTPICDGLGPRARLHVVEGADHGFHLLKRSGRSDEDVLRELADTAVSWIQEILEGAP